MAGKLGRDQSARKAVLRDLITSLIVYEKITTTLAKAKELQKIADKMVVLAKNGSLSARRQAAEFVRKQVLESGQDAIQKLFSDIAARYEKRESGFTRIYKLERRQGDGAEMAQVEFI